MLDAAAVLEPIKADLVVVGAVAVQIALDGHEVLLTPSGDVDTGIEAEDAASVVAHLKEQGMRGSEIPHERGFTWVKGELKVQLMAPFHPPARSRPPARDLPQNNLVGELEEHRWLVAFDADPDRGRFYAAKPAGLVALKEAAFGRERPDGAKVDRDYSDVALLFDRLADEIAAEVRADSQMRIRVERTATKLGEPEATAAAARELVASGQEESRRSAEAMVARARRDMLRALE
jgi:hypothetical protein